MQPSYVVGVLDSSFIELLGDGLGHIVGDPNVPSEIAAGVFGGNNLVAWKSPWQRSVEVPLLGGARFTRTQTDVTQNSADVKAIVASFYAALLENPMFVDGFTGQNAIAPAPSIIVAPTGIFPAGGSASLFSPPTLVYPAGGSPLLFPMPTLAYPIGGSALLFALPLLTYPIGGAYFAASLPTFTYPAAGTTSTFVMPTLSFPAAGTSSQPTAIAQIFPAAGTYKPWSNSNSLAVAHLTDQYL